MITTETQITFSWKLPLVVFVVTWLVFLVREQYMVASYKKSIDDFFELRHNSLYNKAKRLQKYFAPSVLPPRKMQMSYYYDLCYILASLSLLSDNEEDFLKQIGQIGEKTYALKPFTLALYYYTKGQYDLAQINYNSFLSCHSPSNHMNTIMMHVFAEGNRISGTEALQHALSEFKNPTIIFLLKRAKLINDD